jgi:hypothetical protein
MVSTHRSKILPPERGREREREGEKGGQRERERVREEVFVALVVIKASPVLPNEYNIIGGKHEIFITIKTIKKCTTNQINK